MLEAELLLQFSISDFSIIIYTELFYTLWTFIIL